MKEAMYYENKGSYIHCSLCPHNCHIKEGKIGRCGVRQVANGKLYSLNYGEISAINIDPIEKKPIAQWMPGSQILSFGSFGCNLYCDFCQNHTISLERPQTIHMMPGDIVRKALELKVPSIGYTYNEPSIFYEMMWDTAKEAKEKGLYNVIVTNGYIQKQPLLDILPYIDAMNIDVKTYNDEIYKSLGGLTLDLILKTVEEASKRCHVEISLLIVPGISDDIDKMKELLQKLHSINKNLVLHISRYFPRYKYKEEPTDTSVLIEIRDMALKYFNKIYLGNVW